MLSPFECERLVLICDLQTERDWKKVKKEKKKKKWTQSALMHPYGVIWKRRDPIYVRWAGVVSATMSTAHQFHFTHCQGIIPDYPVHSCLFTHPTEKLFIFVALGGIKRLRRQ